MKTNAKRHRSRGYIAYVTVLATAAILTFMMLFAYKRALLSQAVQSDLQLKMDYSEKEDVILRSIIAITPNRAMRAMKENSAIAGVSRDSLRWQNIFNEAIIQANAGTSVTTQMKSTIGQGTSISSNTGDGAMASTNLIFTNIHGAGNSVYVTPGTNRPTPAGFSETMVSSDGIVNANDFTYPMISSSKNFSGLGPKDYKLIPYPSINFGYGKPGSDFLAKKNWWAFSLDLADHDRVLASSATTSRTFALSIYEVPSQLAISASSFVNLGKFNTGADWSNIKIEGQVFADNAVVEGRFPFSGLATRTGMTLASGTSVGGQSFNGNPFEPGVREQYEVSNAGYFPVSMPSESGRAAFIPINRGEDFFDRHSPNNDTEANTLSTTKWNEYSSGALQCAMRLDVIEATGGVHPQPTKFRFEYYSRGSRRILDLPPIQGAADRLPEGFIHVANKDESFIFGEPVDVAYGNDGKFYFKSGVSGAVKFSDDTFNWTGTGARAGFYRPRVPFTVGPSGPLGRICISVFPERFPKFLAAISGDDVTVNNSLVVNSNYRSNIALRKPSFPADKDDFGLILTECGNLSAFKKGFSLVTNFCLYIGSDFNTTSIAPRSGYKGTLPYFPPCSLFAPEKRFGMDMNTYNVGVTGQISSLATKDRTKNGIPARPLDTKNSFDLAISPSDASINLRPLLDPADLPPVTMMNWLVVIEELRKEF